MSKWVDFNTVHAEVTLSQVIDHYGLLESSKVQGSEITLRCPFHENDRIPSLNINTEKNNFNCFGCGAGGDLLAFVILKQGINTGKRDDDRREAASLLQTWFNLHPKHPRRMKQQNKKELDDEHPIEKSQLVEVAEEESEVGATVINPPLPFPLNNLDPKHEYFSERGLTQDTVDFFGLGYHAGRGIMAKRIAIPLHDAQGTLIGYAGRWPGDSGWPEGEGKYKVPPRKNGFHKSHLLFNLHRARGYASQGLIVVEGFFTVFRLWQRGWRNVVAVMGSSLSIEQERLIVASVGPKGKVLIMFDKDDAGCQGAQDAAMRLVDQVYVRIAEFSG